MSIVPYLCVKGAAEAIEFYKSAFGAVESGARMLDPQGRVGHSTIQILGHELYLSDEHPEIEVLSPASLGGSAVSFVLNVPAVDESFARAVAAGANGLREPEDQFYGARTATVLDPYGFRWSLQTATETLTDEEMQSRVGSEFNVISPTD